MNVFSAVSSNSSIPILLTNEMLAPTLTQAVANSNVSVLQNIKLQLPGAEVKSNLLRETLNSNFASALIGLVGGAIGFVMAQWWERRNRRYEEDQKYGYILESTANELIFYADKMNYLSGQLNEFLENGIIPSYTFYPGLLERSKIQFN